MGRACLLTLVAALASSALADAAPARKAAPRTGQQQPRADLFAGYSHTRAGEAGLDGLGLSGSYPLRGPYSLVGELTLHRGSFAGASLGETSLMGGVRRRWRSGGWSPFAEALLGAVRTSTSIDAAVGSFAIAETDWGGALGGGVDYRLGARWSARGLVQLRLVHGEGALDTDPRISLGAVYSLGR
jgi:hypothetical protein